MGNLTNEDILKNDLNMTEEDKRLITEYICWSIPVLSLKVRWNGTDYNVLGVVFGRAVLVRPFMSNVEGSPLVEEVRPYLRKMSDMTDEEREELSKMVGNAEKFPKNSDFGAIFRFFYEHHLDFLGMIEKNLAIEAPENMYVTLN